jgi:cell division protein ZapA
VTDAGPVRVTVRILDKDVHVACPPDEREDLLQAATFLNGKLRELKDQAKGAAGAERVLVVAALNIANELVKLNARCEQDGKVGVRLKSLRDKVDAALERGQQLEL